MTKNIYLETSEKSSGQSHFPLLTCSFIKISIAIVAFLISFNLFQSNYTLWSTSCLCLDDF